MIKWTLKARQSIWFVPGVYSLASIILTTMVILVDTVFANLVQGILPGILFTNVDLGATILSSIATAILTMTTISFSTIMVVLTTYSSQFSPRTLQDFMTEKSTLRVLGIFVGSFIYTVLTLLFMKDGLEGERVLSSGVGVILAIICVGYFVFFVHHVSRSIQVSQLIERLMEEGLESVEKKKQNADKGMLQFVENEPFSYTEKVSFSLHNTGYIQVIETTNLAKKAKKLNVFISFKKRIGDFVTDRTVIGEIYYLKEKKEELDIASYVQIGEERTTLQDAEFALQKLTEVALRAISPGINDPNTANNCIRYMSRLLISFGEIDSDALLYLDEEKQQRIAIRQRTFEEILYTAFYQIRIYGKNDISVILAILECLILIAEGSQSKIRRKINSMHDFLVGSIQESQFEPLDLVKLEEKKAVLKERLRENN
ncbi:DUF2254 domain-containing protein [Sutcliffiella deserti]|uniref:DUF2254 domain-containing protein n=1 Tax=Sutcliffiella deserti TaxID=2875501 RepID=UPI001CBEB622|nr:DUF2254 domain-containing protein [Sutcliffiella deserti]